MKTALITYADDKFAKNLEEDFFPTLRGPAKYGGPVYVIYYGKNKESIKKISRKYGAEIVYFKKNLTVPNQRNADIAKLLVNIPERISHVLCIDADVWFQGPIDDIFGLSYDSYGFVEELENAEGNFNLNCINQIKSEEIRKKFLTRVRNFKLAASGMIVGKKEEVKKIVEEISRITQEINQDFFGLDQTVFNYVIRQDGKGVGLPQKYDFSLESNPNQFYIKDGLFYDQKKQLIPVIHNSGSSRRLFPEGRKSMKPVPRFPENLPGEFWGITAFFNPAGFKSKIKNYKIFREKSKKQGLKLLTVELAFGNQKFELKKTDADILIQLRSETVMWQKERLLNIGLENLPENCDKFVWLDSDIIFCNENWVKETAELLEFYAVVQPFESVMRMPKNIFNIESAEGIPFGLKADIEGLRSYGMACRVSQLGIFALQKGIDVYGVSGFAWAARRELFSKQGLFDAGVLACDLLMACSFYGEGNSNYEAEYNINEKVKKIFLEWSKNIAKKTKSSVYFTKGTILHLWHGTLKNRGYEKFLKIINENGFDPATDLKKDSNGCWVLSSDKPNLRKDFKKYFYARNEDNSFMTKIILALDNLKGYFLSFKSSFKKDLQRFRHNLYLKFDRGLGLFGLFLKKYSPGVYKKLKRAETVLIIFIRRHIIKKDIAEELLRKYPIILGMVTEDNIRIILANLKKVLDNRIEGDIVELGCHMGTTSLFIQRALEYYKSDKKFYVYDSFEGLPKKHTKDYSKNTERKFLKGDAQTSKYSLANNFKNAGLNLPIVHAGWFKDQEYPEKIAFAFFDGDFYTSIKDSFEKVYPKLIAGGIICVHDYKWDVLPGVEKACDEFLRNKPEEGTVISNNGVGILSKKENTKTNLA